MKLEQLKLSPSTRIATADKVTTKSTRNSVKWWDHSDKIKTIR